MRELRWEDRVQLYRQTLDAIADLRNLRRAVYGSQSEPLPEEVLLREIARTYMTPIKEAR